MPEFDRNRREDAAPTAGRIGPESEPERPRKIIHVDMDAFQAATTMIKLG
jgi:hypothetical protein